MKTEQISYRRASGMTLLEMMTAVGLSTLVLAGLMALYVGGLQSFASMGSYREMKFRTVKSVDDMLRDMREATGVLDYQNNPGSALLQLTNSIVTNSVTYSWDQATGTVTGQKAGEAPVTYLIGCSQWSCKLVGAPTACWTFADADKTACKGISMCWQCWRTNGLANSEKVQTAQVILRNKQ